MSTGFAFGFRSLVPSLNTRVKYSLMAGEILTALFCFLRAHPWDASSTNSASLVYRLSPILTLSLDGSCCSGPLCLDDIVHTFFLR